MSEYDFIVVGAGAERLVKAVRVSRKIFTTKAFSSWIEKKVMPGPNVQDDEQLNEFVRRTADSYHHQVGSCKMGLDEMAVVDPHLRVYGVERVRVADASVMPFLTSGNCHTGIVMIGEKVSALLKDAYNLHG